MVISFDGLSLKVNGTMHFKLAETDTGDEVYIKFSQPLWSEPNKSAELANAIEVATGEPMQFEDGELIIPVFIGQAGECAYNEDDSECFECDVRSPAGLEDDDEIVPDETLYAFGVLPRKLFR